MGAPIKSYELTSRRTLLWCWIKYSFLRKSMQCIRAEAPRVHDHICNCSMTDRFREEKRSTCQNKTKKQTKNQNFKRYSSLSSSLSSASSSHFKNGSLAFRTRLDVSLSKYFLLTC